MGAGDALPKSGPSGCKARRAGRRFERQRCRFHLGTPRPFRFPPAQSFPTRPDGPNAGRTSSRPAMQWAEIGTSVPRPILIYRAHSARHSDPSSARSPRTLQWGRIGTSVPTLGSCPMLASPSPGAGIRQLRQKLTGMRSTADRGEQSGKHQHTSAPKHRAQPLHRVPGPPQSPTCQAA